MGKTTPTYRDAVTGFEDDRQLFWSFLRRRHQSHFDRIVEHAYNFADAGGVRNPVEPKWAILVSICLAQEREIAELEERVAELEGS